MDKEQIQTQRRRPRWTVWAPVLALTLVLGVLVSSSQAAPAVPPYFVRGGFNGWAPVDIMIEGPPGFHWLEIPIAPDGRYEWKAGRWVWTAGHWQRAKAGFVWEPGHWERRGNRYHWVKGRWVKSGPKVRDHRKGQPPPPARKNERVPARRGN